MTKPFLHLLVCFFATYSIDGYTIEFTDVEISKQREEVREMFYHAYEGYVNNAYPYDELRPLTCDGHDTWGSYSLTLIDALDTLAVMGNKSEFQRVAKLIVKNADFDVDINVSVFETNIRIIGGLVSAHLMARRMDMPLDHGWPCNGTLLNLAVSVANRLLPAFDTPTGMPYGTVNLRDGVPVGETPVTCSAGVGTYIVEFGTLSRLTGNPIYEEVALRALNALWEHRSSIDLIGNHINVVTGKWTAVDAGIGAGVDSFYEYLVKGAALLQRPELMVMFERARTAVEKHLRHDDWHVWGSMSKGQVTQAVFQSLEAYWPGVLSLVGDTDSAMKIIHNYHQVWKQFGFTPEFYHIAQGDTPANREGYPLRPELAESLVYLYQSTHDPTLLKMGADIVSSIQHTARTQCGYATVKNVNTHTLENRMESFFLAETTKYLYLLFDTDHWLHESGNSGRVHRVGGRECIIEAGAHIFNTEAHPVDAGALLCCSAADWTISLEEQIRLVMESGGPFVGQGKLDEVIGMDGIVKNGKKHSGADALECNGETYAQMHKEMAQLVKSESTILAGEMPHVAIERENSHEVVTFQDHLSVSNFLKTETDNLLHEEAVNQLEDLVEVQLDGNEEMQVEGQEENQVELNEEEDVKKLVEAQIEDHIGNHIGKHVENRVGDHIEQQIEVQLENNLDEQMETNVKKQFDDSLENNLEHNNMDSVRQAPQFSSLNDREGETDSSNGMEFSSGTPSVSSSKYLLSPPLIPSATAPPPRIREDHGIPQIFQRKQHFALDGLKRRLASDMASYYNTSAAVSYSMLSCPHPPFTFMLNVKGQMFHP